MMEDADELSSDNGCGIGDRGIGPDGDRTRSDGDSAIRLSQGASGMWFATRENDQPIFVAHPSLDALCSVLPDVIRRAETE